MKTIVIDGVEYELQPKNSTTLFITEDCHQITNPDSMVFYVSRFKIRERKAKNMVHLDNKKFAHRANAEHFIKMNKPLLSVMDVIELTTEPPIGTHLKPTEIEKLKEVAERKLGRC